MTNPQSRLAPSRSPSSLWHGLPTVPPALTEVLPNNQKPPKVARSGDRATTSTTIRSQNHRFAVSRPPNSRPAFTLLELILAVTISVVLMGALYLALSTQYYHAKSGREIIDETTLARTLLNRMANDISSNLGPPALSDSSTATALETPTETTTKEASEDPSSSSSTTPSSTTMEETSGPFNQGIQGGSQHLVLTVSRFPRELSQAPPLDNPSKISDLRRITYWLVANGDQVQGLARQEIIRITGPEANALPPDVPDPESYVISSQVKNVAFEYFNGSSWQSSWDGASTGPPAAIAITLTLATSNHMSPDGKARQQKYRHVVAIPTANRLVEAETTAP